MLDEKIEKTVQSTNEDKISLLTFILSEVRKSMDLFGIDTVRF